jgi:hypothetical protein
MIGKIIKRDRVYLLYCRGWSELLIIPNKTKNPDLWVKHLAEWLPQTNARFGSLALCQWLLALGNFH